MVEYECEFGHRTIRTVDNVLHNPTCNECKMIYLSYINRGELSQQWKGGLVKLRIFCTSQIADWRLDSIKNSGYKCVITGKPFDHVHHLYSLAKIISDSLSNLGLDARIKMSDYSKEERESIRKEIRRLHYYHPLGVCLSKNVHNLFHKIYGKGETTPEQWYEFVKKIKNKEILIKEDKT